MGKYTINEDSADPDIFSYYMIANELAEANRLKVLEISLNQGLITERQELRDKLVDRA
jgi:hypothetical protein